MNNKISAVFYLIPFAAFIGCSEGAKEKYFSGTIEYAYSYSSDSLDVDSLTKARPAKGFFRYDATDYQNRFTGTDTVTYYYSGGLNNCVSETGVLKNYECEDYGTATDSVLSWKLYDTDERVLDYSCRILELQKTRSRVKYYVSKEIKMAPATYLRHRSYNWDIYGEKAEGGLVLKLEHRFKNFTMHGAATVLNTSDSKFRALEIDTKAMAELCAGKK
jgi:hypothetical protein